jgi:DHA1 family multidrug resistance protein-like MFS transporter
MECGMSGSAGTAHAEPANPYWRSNAFALFFGCLCSALGFSCAWPYIPIILRDLGVTHDLEAWVGYLVGGFMAMSFLLTPVWGGLADHYGKRTLLLRAGFGMAAGFVLLPLVSDLRAFLGIFLFIGAANGYIPGALAMMAATAPAPFVGRALATLQMGTLVGTTCGPALGALLVGWLVHPVYLFWISGALTFAAGSIGLLFTREDFNRPVGRFHLTVKSDITACLRVPGLPLLYAVNGVFAMTFLGSATVVSLFTLHLMAGEPQFLGHGVPFWVGSATLAMTVASMGAAYAWGRLLDRHSAPLILALALLTACASSVALPLAGNPLQLTIARALLGALTVGIQPAVLRLVKERAPRGMEARALGLAAAVQMLGNGSAPMLAGMLAPSVGLRGYFALNSALLLGVFGLWTARGSGIGAALSASRENDR